LREGNPLGIDRLNDGQWRLPWAAGSCDHAAWVKILKVCKVGERIVDQNSVHAPVMLYPVDENRWSLR
jgi:hypothetical protein